MMARSQPNRRTSHSGDWAFALTVGAARLSTFLASADELGWPRMAALTAMGVVYTIIGYAGFGYAHSRAGVVRVLYVAVQLPLAMAMIYVGQAGGFLILLILPLVSHGQTLFPGRGAVVVAVLIVLASALTVRLLGESWESVATTSLTVAAGVVFVYAFTQTALREREARAEVERLAADLRAANDQLREYATQVEELAITQERNRVAREIHDSLGHYLTVVNVQLEAAQALMGADPERARAALSKAQSLAQEGLKDIRRSVAALRAAPTEDRPLPEAVRLLVDECRAAGIVAQLTLMGAPRVLPPQTELTLYRVAQEALTNVRKHAHASRADITLDYGANGTVRLFAQDNGVGSPASDGGFGLLGLHERVQLLGGQVRVITASGEGFKLEVEVPG
jgi:signal transduction histidine kinase